jgi:hypothetical protein
MFTPASDYGGLRDGEYLNRRLRPCTTVWSVRVFVLPASPLFGASRVR